ncbi:hypothetical protein [Sorangium sp. So ce363]|uniref:hypothetical protein n=1 Tax=Sorangium sp. So ce363 TaxID=3133304 RepID=UPI003F62AE39
MTSRTLLQSLPPAPPAPALALPPVMVPKSSPVELLTPLVGVPLLLAGVPLLPPDPEVGPLLSSGVEEHARATAAKVRRKKERGYMVHS